MHVQFARRVVVYPDTLSPFGDGCQVGFVAIELFEGCAVAQDTSRSPVFKPDSMVDGFPPEVLGKLSLVQYCPDMFE